MEIGGLETELGEMGFHHGEQDWEVLDLGGNSDLEEGFVVLVGDLQKRQQKDLQIQDWRGQF